MKTVDANFHCSAKKTILIYFTISMWKRCAKKTVVKVTWMYCLQILNNFVANPTNGLNIVTATTVFENEFKLI